ncbi:MAG: RNA polymerase sigma factor [Ruminiclostridium sp.]|nr:RNA polymerase sigma factor [Ruminiclostridium sp.]
MTDNDFERYVGLYRAGVTRAALCILRDPDEAEDIAQEVFLRLYTYDGAFDSDEHVKAWLLRCAANMSVDVLRSYRRRNGVSLSGIGERAAPDDTGGSVMPAVMTLPPKQRIAIYLHYCEGYTVDETAAVLKISRSAVKQRLKSGRDKLKALIKGEIEDDV